jgi:hypothetical protein
MSNRVDPFGKRNKPVESANGARAWTPPVIADAGSVRVAVLSLAGYPSFLVAKTSFGRPRKEFVDEMVKTLYGVKPDGSKHEWEIVEELLAPPPPPAAERISIPITANRVPGPPNPPKPPFDKRMA